MQKTSTSSKTKRTELFSEKQKDVPTTFEPSRESLNKIMQFACNYRAQKINTDQHVEWLLN